MIQERITVCGIPAIVWGAASDRVWLCVHGKMSSKEEFAHIAAVAAERGCQLLSFDLPAHGERRDAAERCDIWNGRRDVEIMCRYAFGCWREVSLYACSLGAYFSLHACGAYRFRKCLFQSPIIDMEFLVRRMMRWFDITEERLENEREIETPVDLMTWDYFRFVMENPVREWNTPVCILFGGRDDMQDESIMNDFVRRYGGMVTVSRNSAHPFMEEADAAVVDAWLMDNM